MLPSSEIVPFYYKTIFKTMKLNSNTEIIGQKVMLVPYRDYHVPKYHIWMKSEELQKLTASEPLTLDEEYEMQKSWREDEDKCTFIILDKCHYEQESDEIESMIGDTNIFIVDRELEIGEIEIMLAEETARGKKLGWEAVILMLLYGIKHIHLKMFEAKISFSNEISITMFKKLGFEEKSRSDVFQEVTLQKKVTEEWIEWLSKHYQYEIQTC
ncbi:alpha/beta-tubulin-N-acetyltransferase 9 isoform X1 [Pectinophora gossypiella]|uniref:N-acetyltransferase 9-like protein n=2 Tax=Pectinophora gossypiella TaxID=13191 RepID=A0A1E1WJX1_PECGO|nr:alpha/beta-tubulin-N-acetyltransferase 9 isoform X1 [Pectinophora gossypiella]